MPKIITGLRERLLEAAERQLITSGYASMTIRMVAKECNVAVGTVYNYFSGKEEFAASVLLERWKKALEDIDAVAAECRQAQEVVQRMYEQLCSYMDQYKVLFRDEAAIAIFTVSMARYHEMLRCQLAKPLLPFCQREFEAEFIAEALLTWTVAGKSFDEIYYVVHKILNEEK